MTETVPLGWIEMLEWFEELAKQEGGGKQHITLDAVTAKAKSFQFGEYPDVDLKQEVADMLRQFHRMGFIVYRSETPVLQDKVVLQPQWLIDAASTFIRDFDLHPHPRDDAARKREKSSWQRLKTSARLEVKLVRELWPTDPYEWQGKSYPGVSQSDRTFLLNLLVRHSLLVPLRPDKDGDPPTAYMVPALLAGLEEHADSGCSWAGSGGVECALTFVRPADASTSVKWNSDQHCLVPPGVFARVVGKAIQHMIDTNPYSSEDLEGLPLARNFVEVRSHDWKYRIIAHSNVINFQIDPGLCNPLRILKRCIQVFVDEVVAESGIKHVEHRYLVGGTHCLQQAEAVFRQNSQKAPPTALKPWFPAATTPSTFDVFISYRHSENSRNTNTSTGCDSMRASMLNDALGWAAIGAGGHRPTVFFDSTCLPAGERIGATLSRAVLNSTVFIPIMSNDCLRSLRERQKQPGGDDCVDWVLFEWWLALEARELRKTNPAASRVGSILPMLSGPPFCASDFPNEVPCATYMELCEQWKNIIGNAGNLPKPTTIRNILIRLNGFTGVCVDRKPGAVQQHHRNCSHFIGAVVQIEHILAGVSHASSSNTASKPAIALASGGAKDPWRTVGLDAMAHMRNAAARNEPLRAEVSHTQQELAGMALSERPTACQLQDRLLTLEWTLDAHDGASACLPPREWEAIVADTVTFFKDQITLARETIAVVQAKAQNVEGDSQALYTATMKDLRVDPYFDQHFEKLSVLANSVAHRMKMQGAKADICRWRTKANKPLQRKDDLFAIHADSHAVRDCFAGLVGHIASKSGCTFTAGPRKKMWRSFEKLGIRKKISLQNGSELIDITRGTIEAKFDAASKFLDYFKGCDKYEEANSGYSSAGFSETHGKIVIVHVKNKWKNPAAGGWCCGQLYFYFVDDPAQHICELQVCHTDMQTARKEVPNKSYDGYSRFRCFAELLRVVRTTRDDGDQQLDGSSKRPASPLPALAHDPRGSKKAKQEAPARQESVSASRKRTHSEAAGHSAASAKEGRCYASATPPVSESHIG